MRTVYGKIHNELSALIQECRKKSLQSCNSITEYINIIEELKNDEKSPNFTVFNKLLKLIIRFTNQKNIKVLLSCSNCVHLLISYCLISDEQEIIKEIIDYLMKTSKGPTSLQLKVVQSLLPLTINFTQFSLDDLNLIFKICYLALNPKNEKLYRAASATLGQIITAFINKTESNELNEKMSFAFCNIFNILENKEKILIDTTFNSNLLTMEMLQKSLVLGSERLSENAIFLNYLKTKFFSKLKKIIKSVISLPYAIKLTNIVKILIINFHKKASHEISSFINFLILFPYNNQPIWKRDITIELLLKIISEISLIELILEDYTLLSSFSRMISFWSVEISSLNLGPVGGINRKISIVPNYYIDQVGKCNLYTPEKDHTIGLIFQLIYQLISSISEKLDSNEQEDLNQIISSDPKKRTILKLLKDFFNETSNDIFNILEKIRPLAKSKYCKGIVYKTYTKIFLICCYTDFEIILKEHLLNTFQLFSKQIEIILGYSKIEIKEQKKAKSKVEGIDISIFEFLNSHFNNMVKFSNQIKELWEYSIMIILMVKWYKVEIETFYGSEPIGLIPSYKSWISLQNKFDSIIEQDSVDLDSQSVNQILIAFEKLLKDLIKSNSSSKERMIILKISPNSKNSKCEFINFYFDIYIGFLIKNAPRFMDNFSHDLNHPWNRSIQMIIELILNENLSSNLILNSIKIFKKLVLEFGNLLGKGKISKNPFLQSVFFLHFNETFTKILKDFEKRPLDLNISIKLINSLNSIIEFFSENINTSWNLIIEFLGIPFIYKEKISNNNIKSQKFAEIIRSTFQIIIQIGSKYINYLEYDSLINFIKIVTIYAGNCETLGNRLVCLEIFWNISDEIKIKSESTEISNSLVEKLRFCLIHEIFNLTSSDRADIISGSMHIIFKLFKCYNQSFSISEWKNLFSKIINPLIKKAFILPEISHQKNSEFILSARYHNSLVLHSSFSAKNISFYHELLYIIFNGCFEVIKCYLKNPNSKLILEFIDFCSIFFDLLCVTIFYGPSKSKLLAIKLMYKALKNISIKISNPANDWFSAKLIEYWLISAYFIPPKFSNGIFTPTFKSNADPKTYISNLNRFSADEKFKNSFLPLNQSALRFFIEIFFEIIENFNFSSEQVFLEFFYQASKLAVIASFRCENSNNLPDLAHKILLSKFKNYALEKGPKIKFKSKNPCSYYIIRAFYLIFLYIFQKKNSNLNYKSDQTKKIQCSESIEFLITIIQEIPFYINHFYLNYQKDDLFNFYKEIIDIYLEIITEILGSKYNFVLDNMGDDYSKLTSPWKRVIEFSVRDTASVIFKSIIKGSSIINEELQKNHFSYLWEKIITLLESGLYYKIGKNIPVENIGLDYLIDDEIYLINFLKDFEDFFLNNTLLSKDLDNYQVKIRKMWNLLNYSCCFEKPKKNIFEKPSTYYWRKNLMETSIELCFSNLSKGFDPKKPFRYSHAKFLFPIIFKRMVNAFKDYKNHLEIYSDFPLANEKSSEFIFLLEKMIMAELPENLIVKSNNGISTKSNAKHHLIYLYPYIVGCLKTKDSKIHNLLVKALEEVGKWLGLNQKILL